MLYCNTDMDLAFILQMGVSTGKTSISDLRTKFENVIRKLQVPVQVFIATHKGKYRKPSEGMWNKLRHMV